MELCDDTPGDRERFSRKWFLLNKRDTVAYPGHCVFEVKYVANQQNKSFLVLKASSWLALWILPACPESESSAEQSESIASVVVVSIMCKNYLWANVFGFELKAFVSWFLPAAAVLVRYVCVCVCARVCVLSRGVNQTILIPGELRLACSLVRYAWLACM